MWAVVWRAPHNRAACCNLGTATMDAAGDETEHHGGRAREPCDLPRHQDKQPNHDGGMLSSASGLHDTLWAIARSGLEAGTPRECMHGARWVHCH